MPNTREKLIALLNEASEILLDTAGGFNDNHGNGMRADHLIANGVTIQSNEPLTNCQQWIPVTERLPKNFVSVLGYMTDAGDFPPVRECYTVGNAFFFPALGDKHPVSHWMEMPEPPKEV